MTKINMTAIIILVFVTLSVPAFAQERVPINRLSTSPDPDAVPSYFYELDPGPRATDRGVSLRAYGEGRVLKKGLLAPSAADRSRFASFLLLKNTGLIHLLPREVYDTYITHTKSPVSIRGGGAYYSFASRTHVYGYGSDIQLSHNEFSVGLAGDDYGMLTMFGDTPLEQITAKDPRAHFIATYKPATTERQARVEGLRFAPCWGSCTPTGGGLLIDGLHYRRSMPLVENSTYLLRSIVYYYSDVLVAFRVVRRDQDGSVIIAWKLLKDYKAPTLKRK
jgi:hypothetical protein